MINIIFPLFDGMDAIFSLIFPLSFKILLWGLLAGLVAMLVYVLFAQQTEIKKLKSNAASLRKRMLDSELSDVNDFSKLAKQNLLVSLCLLKQVFLPTLLSGLPVIILAIWVDIQYSHQLPQSNNQITVNFISNTSEQLQLKFESEGIEHIVKNGGIFPHEVNEKQNYTIYHHDELIYSGQIFRAPYLNAIGKKNHWYSFLISSPNYLTKGTSIEAILFNLPQKIILNGVPNWMSSWHVIFFFGVFIMALFIKIVFKIN